MLSAVYDSRQIALDTAALSLLGEAAALLAGHRTLHLVEGRLHRRSAPMIHLEPRPLIGTIHRTHRCGQRVDSRHVAVGRKVYDGEDPPF
ncbi:hypothetical protein F5X71_34785 [Nocardia brasiliensis]|uniref:Uncharacterized protein n=1 Tax=Nocardia brasiliensis TaxID=37326 RepID=A0A6G9Y0R3_NOCBR|nr:hypothetical protein [Nocardia brasiliensis]QIS06792.1 hypothetical protein F5X71_34785 [Nocardia brasiliensis]